MELKRKCLPLDGIKSLRAMNSLYALLIGMKMIPGNAHLSLEELAEIVKAMSQEDQIKFFTNAAQIVPLDPEDLKALVLFCTDKNKVPYSAENMKNLSPSDLIEVIVTVCLEIIKIRVDLVTEEEKKNSSPSQLMSAVPS